MQARCLLIACLILLGATSTLWAGPFAEVPSDHWAYAACARLAEMGLLSSGGTTDFSGNPQFTRFEFGVALLDPLTRTDAAIRSLPPGAHRVALLKAAVRALGLSARLSEHEVAQTATDLRRLTEEFGDVLRSLDFNTGPSMRALAALADPEAVRDWRAEALSAPKPLLVGTALQSTGDILRLPVARGTLSLNYRRDLEPPELLDYLALSAATAQNDGPALAGPAEPAVRDPLVSRLRTAYDYGLGSALTLSLAYEEIARTGQGLSALDSASLASVALGYQVTPSTSIKLSYSLLEYANYVFDTPPLRDRVAETAVSIGF